MAGTKDRITDMKPYVERAMTDEDLRENVVSAFAAAREVYDEMLGNRGVRSAATRVATNKDIQDNLKTALDELREAADRLQGKADHGTRNTMLLLTGIALGVLMNPMTGPATRRWIKDKVHGPSDEFTYGGGDSFSGGDSFGGGESFGGDPVAGGGETASTGTTGGEAS